VAFIVIVIQKSGTDDMTVLHEIAAHGKPDMAYNNALNVQSKTAPHFAQTTSNGAIKDLGIRK